MTRWQMFTEALAEWRQERSERRALEHTLSAFARIHPTWHGALFDEPFLRRFAPRALLALSPRELAVEWSRQFSYGDQRRRERDIRRVTAVAEHFQSLLSEELRRLEAAARRRMTRRRPRAERARLGARLRA